MSRFDPTQRLGEGKVNQIFLQFKWIPRTISESDVGIDMIVEICKNDNPIGKFFGVQVKTGNTYFKEKQGGFIIFRASKDHVDYWINNSLPVIIVLHDLNSNTTIWQVITKLTVESTGKHFKIKVPLSNVLEKTFAADIERLTETPHLLNKFHKLLLDKPILDLLQNGNKVVVEFTICVKKTSGKADITVYHVINDTNIEEEIELKQIELSKYTVNGVHSYLSLYYFYPWADFKLDESFYETFSDYNEEEMPGYKLVFIDDRFHGYKLPIIPYQSNGGISTYRLIMYLNDYGRTFIDFYDFTNGNKQLEIKFDQN